jgi:hypothetical protein
VKCIWAFPITCCVIDRARVLIVTMLAMKAFPEFNAEHQSKYDDFVILMDGKLLRNLSVGGMPTRG